MANVKLQEFATITVARGRITFGDVRRLTRDCLPDGISMCEEAEILIRLDATVARADKAWCAWLVSAMLDFLVANTRPPDGIEVCERLRNALAATHLPTKALRQISRELHHHAGSPESTIPFPAKGSAPQAMLPGAEGVMARLELAA